MNKPQLKTTFSIHPLNTSDFPELAQMGVVSFPFFTFAYLLEGEALVEVDGKNILVGPGQMLLIPENLKCCVRHFEACRGFDGKFSMEVLKDVSHPVLRNTQPILQSFWFDDAVFMGALMQRMLTAYEDRDKAFVQSALDLILSQLRPGGRVAQVPEKFLQLVFERGKVPASVTDYVTGLGVTPNYLNKTVKAHTHRTAIDWIEIARLNLAKQFLKDPLIPIAEVAERTGLDDQSYFSRFFKRKTGMTPSQYRNGQR